MEFDLYFDESGDFRSSCQNWLIGGYLRPRQRGADAQAVQWWTNVREELESVCAGLLRNGYKLSHCSQNSFPAKRTIQPKVLKSLTENIQAVGGFPVIFFPELLLIFPVFRIILTLKDATSLSRLFRLLK